MTVNTKSVAGYRALRFGSIGDLLAEARRCAEAERRGSLRRLGNWSAGQIFAHLAAFMNYPYDGYPPTLGSPPWIIRVILKRFKNKYLYRSLPRGVRIPKVPGGTVGADDVSTDEGLARLEAAAARLQRQPPATPNLIFGPLTHDEWMNLHCRHAELHLGYLVPDAPGPSPR
ncbi:MAG: DUF1569 domain-containing protein [Phycisphaerae bacterium]|nr:DUF1569 domain-containing protein [Phycisphaerae bacterium]